jgi:hypothetical protein
MGDETKNNSITGTWKSGSAGALVAGQVTTFKGTISATGETFTATSYSINVGASGPSLPITPSTGYFTFNGPIESFAGWSGGATGSALVNAEYQMTTDGHSLVMYGLSASLGSGPIDHPLAA